MNAFEKIWYLLLFMAGFAGVIFTLSGIGVILGAIGILNFGENFDPTMGLVFGILGLIFGPILIYISYQFSIKKVIDWFKSEKQSVESQSSWEK